MPQSNRKSADPRTLLKEKEPEELESTWGERVQEFDSSHVERIWDLVFSKAIEVALVDSNRGKDFEDRLRILAKNTKAACILADRVVQVYAEHRHEHKGVFIAAAEIINQES